MNEDFCDAPSTVLLLEHAGGHNLATLAGYKALSIETLVAPDPQVVILHPRFLEGGLGPSIPDGLASLSRAFYPSAQALNSEGRP
ncbi:hypothetical protein [Pseudomonas nitroreducens]|uniref:hypothetical protein n=1 Tax=Pseudomonas nitroreducens TaxID=46680 RepID=UPI00351CD0B0